MPYRYEGVILEVLERYARIRWKLYLQYPTCKHINT